jgi:hypothetical protein
MVLLCLDANMRVEWAGVLPSPVQTGLELFSSSYCPALEPENTPAKSGRRTGAVAQIRSMLTSIQVQSSADAQYLRKFSGEVTGKMREEFTR